MNFFATTLVFVTLFFVSLAQGTSQVFSLQQLNSLANQFLLEELQQQREIDSLAALYNIPLRKVFQDGRIVELQGFNNGIPTYYTTTSNVISAATISSNKVHPGGSAGLNLNGNGVVLGMWDGGRTRITHQEFNGRVSQMDAAIDLSDHATHVAGTMVATGTSASAKGMSFDASLNAYDWNSDNSEMTTAAANGLLVSNHSYGTICGWIYNFRGDDKWVWFGDTAASLIEDRNFGFYSSGARSWDLIARNAPNYLIVKSAGNDRGEGPGAQPVDHWIFKNSQWVLTNTQRNRDGNTLGYDCVTTTGNAKNILTVGAVDDIPGGYSQPSDVIMSSFSGYGPTDDGRIKPDIVANGIGLNSPTASTNSSYQSYSGTSMSSPSISGSLGLLLQHQKNLHPTKTLLSSTLKAIVLHTADEAGSANGPDYRFGWGLMNTKKATDLMTLNSTRGASGFDIQELTLNNNDSVVISVQSNGNQPLRATIVWNDVQGTTSTNTLNPTTLRLVNDLDMRVRNASNQTFNPWVLDPANPASAATTGDNFRDNVEQVHIQSPVAGQYTIVIRHKGSLNGGSQVVSLALSGAEPASSPITPLLLQPTVNENSATPPIVHKWRAISGATYQVEIATDTMFANIVTSGIQPDTSFTFSNALPNTKYFWRVIAMIGLDQAMSTIRSYQTLSTASANWLLKPDSLSTVNTLLPNFQWKKQPMNGYRLLVSTNSNLSNPIVDNTQADTNRTITTYLNFNTQYYWNASEITGLGPTYNPSITWSFVTFNPIIQHILPTDGAVSSIMPPILQWRNANGINEYNIQVSTNPAFTSNVIINESAISDTTFPTTTLLKNTLYHWRVQPQFGPKSGTWSTAWTFSVPDNNLRKIFPDSSSAIGNTNVTLRWRKLEGTNKYTVALASNPQFITPIVSNSNVTDTSLVVPNLQTNTPYYWTVSATTNLGEVQSSTWQFIIVSKPQLLAPADKSTDSEKLVTFRWRKLGSLNASSFLRLSDKENFSTTIEEVEGLLDTSYVYDGSTTLKQNTTYYWQVRQLIGQDTTLWSDTWSFTTKALPMVSQQYPDSNAIGVPIDTMLYWNAATEVDGYTVRVSTVPTFASTVFERSPLVGETQTTVTGLEHNKKYYWQTRTRKEGEFSSWSNAWPFLTVLSKPNLLLPANDAKVPQTEITFTWQAVTGAENYDLRVSTDSTFATTVVNEEGIVPTTFEYKALIPNSKYFWQVMSKSTKNVGQWSATRIFTTEPISSVGTTEPIGVEIIPNPVNNVARIRISTQSNEPIRSITIRNMIGETVATVDVPQTVQNYLEFDYIATSVANGMYMLDISTTKRKSSYPLVIVR